MTGTELVARHLLARRILVICPALALAVLETLHPNPSGAKDAIQSDWFFWFHMIQLPLVALVAVSVFLLTSGLQNRMASISRWAAAAFAAFFSAYDAAAGIATGFAWRQAQDMSASDQAAVFEATKDMPGLSLIFVISIIGTGAWVVAVVAAAIAVRRNGAPRGPYILLILAGIFLMGGHPFPAGTVAFTCLFAAAVWLERAAAPRATAPA